VAQRVQDHLNAPVLGGLAVYLHGYRRTTTDLDLYVEDRTEANERLRAAGASWRSKKREFVLEHVPIHTVTPQDAKHRVRSTKLIDGVYVVGLTDLIAIKLLCKTWKHGGDVTELIRDVHLDKRLSRWLPPSQRPRYEELVVAVRAAERERERKGLPRF
jgi:hypothetical protein